MEAKSIKINFSKVIAKTDFEGHSQQFDTTKFVGNTMKFSGSILLDIGFEKLAEEIYYSKKEVDIPVYYVDPLKKAILESSMLATIKRELIKKIDEQMKQTT